jgi:hypothetical protein
VRHYDFIEYDDPDYVVENPTVRNGFTWYGVEWALVDAHVYNYHPVTWLSHMLDCEVFGVNAGAHHVVNVLIHSANSALLFLALRLITGAFWRSAFVAALFAWHPLRVESVAWISERKDVLSGFFFCLMLIAYALYARSKVQSPKSKVELYPPSSILHGRSSRYYWLSLIFLALGLLSKPMLVTVPLVLLLLDFWPLCRFERAAGLSSSVRQLVREKIPFFVLSLAVGLMTLFAQRSGGAIVSLHSEGVGPRLATTLAGYLSYLEKIFWPQNLTFLYLRPNSIPGLTLTVAAVVLLTVTTLALFGFRLRSETEDSKSAIVAGWFWFVVMLLPVSGMVQVGLQSMADRYTYLPAIGLGIMVAWGVHAFAWTPSAGRLRRGALIVGCAAVLLACISLTRLQLGFWQNTPTLMEHALAIDPDNYIAHQNLAVYFAKQGRTEAAYVHRQRVLELDPLLSHPH